MTTERSTLNESIDTEKQNDTVTIDEQVKVTFYQMKMFTEMFSDYFSNFDVLYQSLSPKFNRDQVF